MFFYIGIIVEYLFCFGCFVYVVGFLLSALFRIFPVVFIFCSVVVVCLLVFVFVVFCFVWQLVACHTVPSENSYFPLELNDQVAFPDPGRKAGRAAVALAERAQPSIALPCDVVEKYTQNFKRNAFLPSAVGVMHPLLHSLVSWEELDTGLTHHSQTEREGGGAGGGGGVLSGSRSQLFNKVTHDLLPNDNKSLQRKGYYGTKYTHSWHSRRS